MMTAMNNWRLSRKMIVAFSLIAMMMVALGVTGVVTTNQLGEVATRHVQRGIAGTEALGRVMSLLREHRIIIFSQLNAETPAEVAKLDDRFAKNKIALHGAIDNYAVLAGEFGPKVDALKADVVKLDDINGRIFDAKKNLGAAAALPLIKGMGKDASYKAIADAEDLIDLHQKRAQAANEAGQAAARRALHLIEALLAVAMATLFVVWLAITKTVSTPLGEVSGVTKRLAEGGNAAVPHRDRADEIGEVAKAVELFRQAAVTRAEADMRTASEQQIVTQSLGSGLSALTGGDLTAAITADFPPAYAQLKTNFNDALAALRELVSRVSESAQSIRTGSSEIAHASENLARRTEANAASLEQTSAALAQIDGRLKATAVAAGSTVQRADQAIATVGGGRAVADEAVQAMGRVSDSARGIDSVIEGVDKIAFQTRVLAMNAAVEAGRAGDAGRGFAVVADLVSALAMRAEEEAKRARDQLTVTQADIVTAVDAVKKVDGALANISGDVGEVHQLLGSMAADNRAQSSAITEISAAIGTMDQSTQQNAAMVEETSAAARNLNGEVNALTERASQFRVDIGSRAAHTQRPADSSTMNQRLSAPTKPLPAAAVPALVRSGGDADWSEF